MRQIPVSAIQIIVIFLNYYITSYYNTIIMNLFGNARLCKFAKIHCKNPKMPRRQKCSILMMVIVKVQLNAKYDNLNVTF